MAAIGVVAAVNLSVAIQATTTLFNKRIGFGRGSDTWCDARYTGCAVTTVALVTNQRWTGFEQVVGGGAVRHVAIGAIVVDGLVVMHKGAAFFGVTGIAGGCHAVFGQQLGAGCAVGVVAIRTGDLALRGGMMRLFVELCALFFVAGVANLGLSAFVSNFVMGRMHLVA